MKPFAVLITAALALVLAACGSGSSSTSSAPTTASSTASTSQPATGTVKVTMKGIAFNPSALTAKVGQTVQWTNEDPVAHNVTSRGGPPFTSSSTLGQGANFSIKLTQAGTIRYVCTFHPNMIATIVVSK